MDLLDDEALARSSVVANCRMNRGRPLASYNRELGIDVLAFLRSRLDGGGPVRWLDLCCGAANALLEAACDLGSEVEITGVDLVDFFAAPPHPPNLRLITASLATWAPEARFDLITSVHGMHYLGDKLGALARAATWLTSDGLLVANFDHRGIRLPDGTPAGRRLTTALRARGLTYDTPAKRISCRGPRTLDLHYSYLGADDRAGPNYTGQPAVNSHYVCWPPPHPAGPQSG